MTTMTAPALADVTCVLFDLDGTLIDSAPGITKCLVNTIRAFGGPSLRAEELRPFVGPPVADTLRSFLDVPEARLAGAVEHYRAQYLSTGIQQSTLFPGIPSLLAMLRELGVPIAVATSKRESHAHAILQHHGLLSAFEAVSGAREDDTAAQKAEVIASAVKRLGHKASSPVLIGDRSFDVLGALAIGIPVIFAEWGYGTAEESAGAVLVAKDPHEAGRQLRQHLSAGMGHTKGAQS